MKQTKLFWMVAIMIPVLGGCGLFRAKSRNVTKPVTGDKMVFAEASVPLVRKAFGLDYKLFVKGTPSDLSIFTRNDNAYECDYLYKGEQGYLKILDSAAFGERDYISDLQKDSTLLTDDCAIWLSRLNYDELQKNGWTMMNFGGPGNDTFRYQATAFVDIPGDDSTIKIPVVLAKSRAGHNIKFMADRNFPLIVSLSAEFTMSLDQLQTKEPPFYQYKFGPKSMLRYRMVNNGTDEYNFTITNTFWSDTAMYFKVDGDFESESYNYHFSYNIIYRGTAVTNPIFDIIYFSVQNRPVVEKKNNFLFFRKNEIETIVKQGSGYMMVPHFAPSLEDGDTSGMTPEEKQEIQHNYADSYHTKFTLLRTGRLIHTGYYYSDDSTFEEKVLPSLSLRGINANIDLQILDGEKYPLLLYYDDNMEWRISLEYAGYAN